MKVLHSIGQQIWKTQQWPQDWKRSVFIPIQKKGNARNVQTTAQLNSPSKASRTVNQEIPDVQAGFRKGRGIRNQIANICWITGKGREFQKKYPLLLH